MLVDATHDEETRVAVIDGDRLDEFEYESRYRKALKGSIFLAKVTRVEPSLQAAFVNFGGNRHGFLPFSEIHPDYFRIPISDREALMAEQEALIEEATKHEEERDREDEKGGKSDDDAEVEAEDNEDETEDEDGSIGNKIDDADEPDDEELDEEIDGNSADQKSSDDDSKGNKDNRRGGRGRGRRGDRGRGRGGRNNRSRRSEKYEDSPEEAERRFRFNLRRKYKIQEVIKRGQIMLVQVSKEERGNKGAAVGSYLSLPGRYCVLMPNSPRAGGVSRKIANGKDRNRMREIMKDLEVPKGMSVILRTAGMERTKTEIKRDLDYLIKLWNQIRELTLESSAPALVYEEADLIKRAVRDIYTRDIDEIHVAGEEGFKTAKNFMKMMIPSHVKKVKEYKDTDTPLFNKYKVERQIAEIGEAQVTLPSGGYLVINPTEALVSIDVNSGRATKERHIEETALKTNLEAAEEVARQLRLRDLGGLVVIDFIDMEDRRNNGKVERKMRDALSGDRARVQVGRISSFGLMELSRQRLNPSLTEAQFAHCEHCEGTGRIRTADATSIMVLRAIEDEGIKNRAAQVIVHVAGGVALYLLNNKRKDLTRLEEKYDFEILIRVDDEVGASKFRVEVSKPSDNRGDDNSDNNDNDSEEDDDDKKRSSRSRRGRRGGRGRGGRNRDKDHDDNAADNQDQKDSESVKDDTSSDDDTSKDDKKKSSPKKKTAAKKASPKKDDEKAEDKKDDKKDAKKDDKPQETKKKAVAKKSSSKKKSDDKKSEDKKDNDKKDDKAKSSTESPSKKGPSNDDAPSEPEAKKYEKVNETSGEKKKGWWNKLKG